MQIWSGALLWCVCYLLLCGGVLTVLNRLSSERRSGPPTSELVLLHKCFSSCSKFYSSSILNLNYSDLFRGRGTVTPPRAVMLWISLETSQYQWMDGGDPEMAAQRPRDTHCGSRGQGIAGLVLSCLIFIFWSNICLSCSDIQALVGVLWTCLLIHSSVNLREDINYLSASALSCISEKVFE